MCCVKDSDKSGHLFPVLAATLGGCHLDVHNSVRCATSRWTGVLAFAACVSEHFRTPSQRFNHSEISSRISFKRCVLFRLYSNFNSCYQYALRHFCALCYSFSGVSFSPHVTFEENVYRTSTKATCSQYSSCLPRTPVCAISNKWRRL